MASAEMYKQVFGLFFFPLSKAHGHISEPGNATGLAACCVSGSLPLSLCAAELPLPHRLRQEGNSRVNPNKQT